MNVKVIGLQSLAILPREKQVELTHLYQKVYGAAPWNELCKCGNPECGEFWGFSQSRVIEELNHRHCGLPMIPCWTEEDLLDEFKKISSKKNFCATLAFDMDMDFPKLVGFCWGYQFDSEEEVDTKLEMPGLGKIIGELEGPVVYLADLAVEDEYRENGIAKMLTRLRNEQMQQAKVVSVFTRTKDGQEPSVTNVWYEKIGLSVVVRYNDSRERVIRAGKLKEIRW
jgi:ribosomal protein S18 acetylase RimI-like enzyme